MLEGALGLLAFAGSAAGPTCMIGSTGGYVVGLLVAAALIERLADRGWNRSSAGRLASMTLGHVAIFALGFGWLAAIVKTLLASAPVGAQRGAAGRVSVV